MALFGFSVLSYANAESIFSDVPSTHPYVNAIEYLHSEKIAQGYSDGTFRPDQPITRAAFTKIIIEARLTDAEIEQCQISTNAGFLDTKREAWFYKYVCVAKKNGIIKGYSDGTFRPARPVNFAEATKIVIGAFGHSVQENAVWYLPYFNVLQSNNAVPQTIRAFDQEITRGEMAQMIYLLSKEIDTPVNPPKENPPTYEPPKLDPTVRYGTTFDIEYGTHAKQKLDVFTHDGFQNASVVVAVHGGGYVSGDKKVMHVFTDFLLDQGYVVVTPTYRLSTDGVNLPSPINDVACALAWTKKNIRSYGGNAQKVVIMAHSAGAHASALIAYNNERDWLIGCDHQEDLAVAGFIGSAGVYDIDPLAKGRIRDFESAFDNLKTAGTWDQWESINYVDASDPPALLITGTSDCFINNPYNNGDCTENTDVFEKELKAHAVDVTVFKMPDWKHNDIKGAFKLCSFKPTNEMCSVLEDVKKSIKEFLNNN